MVEATRIQLPRGFVSPGTRLSGIYEIDAPLAKGGMGEVYRGHAIETGDPVAIKLIRADMADDENALALFRREASALNRLHHEAIVRYFVFSLDPILRRHYLAMELVEGVSLSDLLVRGPLDVKDTLNLLRRIASGLQAAHERGVVHRDVSPDNIIIPDGDVRHARIIDFGIARSTRVGDTTVIGGGFAGKYNYVSPEQLGLFGGEVTGTSDIYSLGLVLAQCLRGKAIDMGGSQADIIQKRQSVPDLAGIDSNIRGVIATMLQPNPLTRPASMAEVISLVATTATGNAGGGAKSSEPPSAPRRALKERTDTPHGVNRVALSMAAVATLGVATFVGYLFLADPWAFDRSTTAPARQEPILARPVDPPPQSNQQAVVVPPPAATENPIDPADKVSRFTRDYDGGACFLALPTSITATTASIDAFASEIALFDTFDSDFKRAIGWEAMIDGGQIASTQCTALGFIRGLRQRINAAPAKLEIGKTRMKSGDVFDGVLQTTMANVALLLIEEDGKVHDVSAEISGDGVNKSFAMRLSRGPGQRAISMLLMAVASESPITALKLDSTAVSSVLFPVARSEVEKAAGSIEVGMKYFKQE